MATNVPDLWPDDIVVDDTILTPLSILRIQAQNLERRTKAMVMAQISRTKADQHEVLRFELKSPMLGYTYELFQAVHQAKQVYPVKVDAPVLVNPEADDDGIRRCSTPQSFERVLAEVFAASETRAIILSIIAQSTDPAFERPSTTAQQ